MLPFISRVEHSRSVGYLIGVGGADDDDDDDGASSHCVNGIHSAYLIELRSAHVISTSAFHRMITPRPSPLWTLAGCRLD